MTNLSDNGNSLIGGSLESATLEALTSTLRSAHAHLGGSSIGKGFRHAARYHLRKRAPIKAVAKHQLETSTTTNGRSGSPTLLTTPRSSPVTVPTVTSSPLEDYDPSLLEPGVSHPIEDPFYVVDLGIVASQLARWRAAFPRVVPYYAVKCNPDPVVVRLLASLGCNFDCASRGEIELVREFPAPISFLPIRANPGE
jgi:hypothetical protein